MFFSKGGASSYGEFCQSLLFGQTSELRHGKQRTLIPQCWSHVMVVCRNHGLPSLKLRWRLAQGSESWLSSPALQFSGVISSFGEGFWPFEGWGFLNDKWSGCLGLQDAEKPLMIRGAKSSKYQFAKGPFVSVFMMGPSMASFHQLRLWWQGLCRSLQLCFKGKYGKWDLKE